MTSVRKRAAPCSIATLRRWTISSSSCGGTIDKHIGDNVMAVFGAPVAHTDDPERAAQAAFRIHRAMAGLSAELGRPLLAHAEIASGQVVAGVTGSDKHTEYTLTGDTVKFSHRASMTWLVVPTENLILHGLRANSGRDDWMVWHFLVTRSLFASSRGFGSRPKS